MFPDMSRSAFEHEEGQKRWMASLRRRHEALRRCVVAAIASAAPPDLDVVPVTPRLRGITGKLPAPTRMVD